MTEKLTLAEKCRLVAYYGDISKENRDRWLRYGGVKQLTLLMKDHEDPEQEKAPAIKPGSP